MNVARRLFDDAEQRRFANASGDFNPMHVDAIAARRTQAGAPVVHGIHCALWALDALVESGRIDRPIASIDVRFEKFVYVGSDVALVLGRQTENSLRAELVVDGMKTTTLTIGYDAARVGDIAVPAAPVIAMPTTALDLDISDAPERSGQLPRRAGTASAQLFPYAAASIGPDRVEGIAQLSALVGMICPGLHSMLSAVRIQPIEDPEPAGAIAFTVRAVDERFRMVELGVRGSGIQGTVDAFVRRPPVDQPSLGALAEFVRADEFSNTTALVVGGSRGIGALTARAIAAGGGRVVVTYLAGESEARAIAAEIGSARCRIVRFDALQDPAAQLTGLEWSIDQLYYFATPRIFRAKAAGYSRERFEEFCAFYVDGFEALCTALRARRQDLTAFYPSSVFVEERPRDMTEYAMAKAAGEVLCGDMNRFLPGLRIVARRLPRLLTDQTATVMPSESADSIAVMLGAIREMHAGTRER